MLEAAGPSKPHTEPVSAVVEAIGRPETEAEAARPFKVEVAAPTTWFDSLVQAQRGETPRRGFTVGRVELADEVASDLRTTVQIIGAEKDETATYALETKINYSDARIEKDGGFNPTSYAVKVAKMLREKGIMVKFATSSRGQQAMLLERNGVRCGVNLGWSSPVEKPEVSKPDDPFAK